MLFRDFCFLFSQRDRVKFILLNVMLVCCSFIEMATLGSVPLFVAALLGQEVQGVRSASTAGSTTSPTSWPPWRRAP